MKLMQNLHILSISSKYRLSVTVTDTVHKSSIGESLIYVNINMFTNGENNLYNFYFIFLCYCRTLTGALKSEISAKFPVTMSEIFLCVTHRTAQMKSSILLDTAKL